MESNKEIDRLKNGIIKAMQETHDDDTHEFLNRLLQGKEKHAPKYRTKIE